MKKLFVVLTALALIGGFGLMNAQAAGTDSITVTVTMQKLSVSLDIDSWAIGPIAESGSAIQAVVATNDGNVSENLDIALAETTCWAVVSAVPSAEEFAMTHSASGSEAYITTSNSDLKNGVLKDGIVSFNLKFYAPLDDTCSAYAPQSITVTVSAGATS